LDAVVGWQITSAYESVRPANEPKSSRSSGASTVIVGVFAGSAKTSAGRRGEPLGRATPSQ
jgi:hypothetical protein